MRRAVKAFYAVLVTASLAAPAPAVTASARTEDGARAADPQRSARSKPKAEPIAPAPAPAPSVPPVPRAPGVRGLEIGVPAYVWANDHMLSDLTATGPAASVVVLNPGNGDSPSTPPGRPGPTPCAAAPPPPASGPRSSATSTRTTEAATRPP